MSERSARRFSDVQHEPQRKLVRRVARELLDVHERHGLDFSTSTARSTSAAARPTSNAETIGHVRST